ncbi:DUF4190 domain-containing protein [Actinomycetota bacterium Odt1-20B]
MADESSGPRDPWAPPEEEPRDRVPLEKRDPWAPPAAGPPVSGPPVAGPPVDGPPGPSVHDQATMTSMSGFGGGPGPEAPGGEPVPPPPLSPDGPGQMPYGYPGYPAYPGQQMQPGQPGYGWPGMAMAAPSNGLGIAGLVLGIISAVGFCLWPIAIVLGILAVIFGAIGRGRWRRGEATNGGQALAGLICGIVGILLGVGMLVLTIVGALAEDDDPSFSDSDSDDGGYSATLLIG